MWNSSLCCWERRAATATAGGGRTGGWHLCCAETGCGPARVWARRRSGLYRLRAARLRVCLCAIIARSLGRCQHLASVRPPCKVVCHKVGLEYSEPAYYRDIKVWIPDVQFGRDAMPPCPHCKSMMHISPHGWRVNHDARRVTDLFSHYSIMSRRYICST